MYHLVHLWSILTQHPEPRPSVIPDNHGSSPRLHRTTTPLTVHYPYSNYQIIRLSPMQPSGVSPTRSFGYPRCSHPVLSLSTNKPCSSYPCTTYSPPWKPCCPQHADSIPLSFLARSGHFPLVPKWPHVQGNLSRTLGTLFLSFFLFSSSDATISSTSNSSPSGVMIGPGLLYLRSSFTGFLYSFN